MPSKEEEEVPTQTSSFCYVRCCGRYLQYVTCKIPANLVELVLPDKLSTDKHNKCLSQIHQLRPRGFIYPGSRTINTDCVAVYSQVDTNLVP